MNILIGVTGEARAGKDTFARLLGEHGYRRVAFADALKQVVALIADEPVGLYHDDTTKEQYTDALGMTRRQALQLMGTEGGRKVLGDLVWVNRLTRSWRNAGKPRWVVSDVRFDNEAEAIRANGGIIVKIVRPQAEKISTGVAGHASEGGIDHSLVDFHVKNSGTLEDLASSARLVLATKGLLA